MLWNYLDPNNRSLFLECRIVSLPANLDFMIFNHRGKAFPVEMDLKLRQWELLDPVSSSLTRGGKSLHWKIKELGCTFWPLVDVSVLLFLFVALAICPANNVHRMLLLDSCMKRLLALQLILYTIDFLKSRVNFL